MVVTLHSDALKRGIKRMRAISTNVVAECQAWGSC